MDFALTIDDAYAILSSVYEGVLVMFTREEHQSDMRLHIGSWQKTLNLQSSQPHPLAGRRQLAVALMKDPINHILNTSSLIVHHAYLLPQRPRSPMLDVYSR